MQVWIPPKAIASRVALAPDTWERHAVAAALLGAALGSGAPAGVASEAAAALRVLDVGGTPGTLARFLAGAAVTTANVRPPADVVWDGGPLPFADGAFAAATSLDVLEHLPREARLAHLQELLRVSAGPVVACCPLGSTEHARSEAELHRRRPHPFLAEHALHGLPTADELAALVASLPGSWRLLFHGDFRRAAARHLHPLRARLDPLRDTRLADEPGPWTNRVFLVASR